MTSATRPAKPPRLARLNRRARIETLSAMPRRSAIPVSPGLTAGRGLKLVVVVAVPHRDLVSPGLTAGRGLKHAGGR